LTPPFAAPRKHVRRQNGRDRPPWPLRWATPWMIC
jgi:hypothetical protein